MTRVPRPTVVIVGAGLMGGWHAHAVRAIGGRIIAVVDEDEARASALARRHGGQPTTTIEAALRVAVPTAVHICTPVESHEVLLTRALEAGAHALVEKPFAISAVQTRRLLDLAATKGRLACPVHQFLFQRGVQFASKRLPRLGPLHHLDFVACSAGAAGDRDRRDRVAREVLSHPVSLLHRLVGGGVSEVAWQAVSSGPGEFRLTGLHQRATVSLLVSLGGRPTRNTLRVISGGGTIHLDLFHGFAMLEEGHVSRARKILRPFALALGLLGAAGANVALRAFRREPAYPGLRELVRRFYAAAAGLGPVPITPQDTLDVALAVERATAELERVNAPGFPRPVAASNPLPGSLLR